jgi:polysaccharide export outer membrane protein
MILIKKIKKSVGLILVFAGLFSCISSKKIYYLNDVSEQTQKIDSLKNTAIQKIQKGDKVSIIVSCPDPSQTSFLNPFNNQNPGGNASQNTLGFLVDSSGSIDFPLLGQIDVLQLTSTEVADKIKQGLKKYFKEPYVYVTLNGKVFILNGRGGYTVPVTNERLTILEALAQQSSYEPDDKWDEILVIREVDGKRTTAFVDLNAKEILNSPYYYLHNNDVIYIKPGKINATLKSTTAIRSTIGLITGSLALFILLFKK